MASWPSVQGTQFEFRSQGGVNVYDSALTGAQYEVALGVRRLVGTVRFAPKTDAEDMALADFMLALQSGDNEVDMPILRNAGSPGVLPLGAKDMACSAIADAGIEESDATLTWSGVSSASDVSLTRTRGLIVLQDRLVRIRSWSSGPTTSGGTASIYPRLPAATSGISVTDGVLKVRMDVRNVLLAQRGSQKIGWTPITLPWTQVLE